MHADMSNDQQSSHYITSTRPTTQNGLLDASNHHRNGCSSSRQQQKGPETCWCFFSYIYIYIYIYCTNIYLQLDSVYVPPSCVAITGQARVGSTRNPTSVTTTNTTWRRGQGRTMRNIRALETCLT